MMETINSVLNNTADIVGRAVDGLSEVIRVSCEITSRMVQEQATTGLAYVLFGVLLFCVAGFVIVKVLRGKCAPGSDESIGRIIFSLVSLVLGSLVILYNLKYWLNPTGKVVFDLINKFS